MTPRFAILLFTSFTTLLTPAPALEHAPIPRPATTAPTAAASTTIAPRHLATITGDTTDTATPVILSPRHRAVLSARVATRIDQLHHEMGSRFELGEPLITLDPAIHEAAVLTAQARLTHAQSELARLETLAAERTHVKQAEAAILAARANLHATRRLHTNQHASDVELAVAQRDLDIALAQRDLAESQLQADLAAARQALDTARADLRIARHQLEACTVRAPFPGRVTRVLINPHEWVERGTPLIEVLDDTALRARFLLPANAFTRVRIGQQIAIDIAGAYEPAAARITHISPGIDPASQTFEVFARIDNEGRALSPGLRASFNLHQLLTADQP